MKIMQLDNGACRWPLLNDIAPLQDFSCGPSRNPIRDHSF